MQSIRFPGDPRCSRIQKTALVKQLRWLWTVAILMLLSAALPAHAQFRASLRGTVTDASGAVVPGATVTLVDKGTNEERQATSNELGIYTFNALPADQYRLAVEKAGYQKKEVAQLALIPDQPNNLDVQLSVGDVQQTVTVTGSSEPLLNTMSATESATISSEQIQHMPSYNRDVFQLAQLTPGVFGDASQSGGGGSANNPGNQGPGGSGASAAGIFQTENGPQIQARGGQYETNSITIDGISTVSAVWGGTSIITPSEDSVSSVTVVANAYDAEQGRFSGAEIQVTSMGGTNTPHGSAFFKVDRPGLNAYQRWNGEGSNVPGTAAQRGVNRDNSRFDNYGASLGGPLWKNKLFAFFNFEASPYSSSSTAQNWYDTSQFDSLPGLAPIASTILGFKGEGVAAGSTVISRTCASIGLVEGVNCNTESGGLNLGSPLTTGVGHQDLTYGGSSTSPGVGGGLGTTPDIAFFNTVDPTTVSATQWNGRVDADVTAKDHLAGTLYWVPYSNTNFNGPVRTANFWHHSQINNAFALIWNHTFSPTLLNEARANAAGWRWNEISTNPQAPFGLTTANFDGIGTAGVQSLGAVSPSLLDQWTYSYKDTLTKVLGRHNIRTGGEVTRLYYLSDAPWASIPAYSFHNLWDFANDAPYNQGGAFFNVTTGTPSMERLDERTNVWGFFVQDDYKVRPNLTVNLGLRWSYFGGFYSKENNLGVVQFGSGVNSAGQNNALTGMNIRVGGNLQSPQKTNWGPQVGFSWSPARFDSKVVVRGGFGIGYNQNEIAITANGWSNPPNGIQPNFTCAYATFTTNPTCAGNGILYATSSSATNMFGYPSNPAAITTFSSANLPTTGTTGVTAFPSGLKTITNYHYSLEGDYQFSQNMVATLSYTGSRAQHLIIQNNWNAVAAASNIPFNPAVNSVDFYGNLGSSSYNALIATINHTFSHQFQAEAQYTLAKAMDTNSGPYEEDPYPYDVNAAHGLSDYDVRDAIKVFGLWTPVLFHGNNMLEKVAGGWTLGGIMNWHTGFPWNPIYNLVGGSLYCNTCGYGQLRPAQYLGGAGKSTSNHAFEGIGGTNPNYGGDGTRFFKGAINSPVTTPFPAFGPAPQAGIQRNSMLGPHYSSTDVSLTKMFGLPENKLLGGGAGLSFRVDAYNLFNKTNINGGSQQGGGGGGIDNVLGTVNPDGSIKAINADFGVANSALGSRTVQIQTRFSF